MTKSNKINTLRADHVVGLSQASIDMNIGVKILLLGGRALASTNKGGSRRPEKSRKWESFFQCMFFHMHFMMSG